MAKIKEKTTGLPVPARRDPNARKFRTRTQHEADINRVVIIISAIIFAVIVLILAGAFLWDGVIVPNQAVASVGGQNISTRDFQRRVVFERWRTGTLLASALNQYGSQYADQLFGSQQSPYGQLYAQLSSPTLMGRRVLDDMVNDLIVRQYAAANNIKVDQADIDKQIGQFFGYEATPMTSTPTITPSISPTPLVSATPTTTPTLTPVPSQTVTPTPTSFPTGIPTSTPGATERKVQFDKNVTTYYQRVADATNFTQDEMRQVFSDNALRDKVKEAVAGKLQDKQEQAKIRQIVVQTEDQAKDTMTALQQGAAFSNLARAISTDQASAAQGGEVNWTAKGDSQFGTDFDNAVWNDKTTIGSVIGPIKTEAGFHIIQLEGREQRTLTDTEQTQVQDKKFQDWLTAQNTEKNSTKYDIWTERVPSNPTLDQLGLPAIAPQGGNGIPGFPGQ
ncbi:MAG: peptidylprolyl isomerase [Chloroflexota bacterium]